MNIYIYALDPLIEDSGTEMLTKRHNMFADDSNLSYTGYLEKKYRLSFLLLNEIYKF